MAYVEAWAIGVVFAVPACFLMGYYGSRYSRTGSFRKKR